MEPYPQAKSANKVPHKNSTPVSLLASWRGRQEILEGHMLRYYMMHQYSTAPNENPSFYTASHIPNKKLSQQKKTVI